MTTILKLLVYGFKNILLNQLDFPVIVHILITIIYAELSRTIVRERENF
jgi:hypothetical protein